MKRAKHQIPSSCCYTAVITFLLLCTNLVVSNAQQTEPQENNRRHFYQDEKMDDSYIRIAEEDKIRSTSYSYLTSNFSITQVNVDSSGFNIIGDAANEPSLAIDPTNPSRMVIGWRQFETISSNFRQAGVGYSEDGGASWQFHEPLEAELFRSDPVLDTDSDGNFYYNSLGDGWVTDVFKTDDLANWEDKTYAYGGDKQWMVVDKTGLDSDGHVYAFWKAQFTVCPGGSFTRSVDGGSTYEDCVNVPNNPTRGTLAVGPEGALYACGGWNGTFKVLRSTNAKNPNTVVAWDQNVTVDLKGEQALYDGPNPAGMLGQVWVAADYSLGPNYGNVYLLANVDRSDNNDPADLMFSRSTDMGATWSEAIRINTDNSEANWQWFGSLSVAPNGRIDVTWLDTRDNPEEELSALYYSYSMDGGLSWSENERLSESFDSHLGWPNQSKMGDYNHMISDDEGAHLAWAATFNGEQDIYYSFIEPQEVVAVQTAVSAPVALQISILPNPIQAEATIRILPAKTGRISLTLHDVLGTRVGTIANRQFLEGAHQLSWYPNGLAPGIYYLRAETEFGEQTVQKVLVF